jgi:F-type H+-transporting ATPase subunit a
MAVGNSVFQLVGISHEYNAVAGAGLVALSLTGLGLHIRSKLKNIDDHVLPEEKTSILNISTTIVGALRGLLNDVVGHGAEKFLSVIGTTFLFILLCKLTGLIPGFLPATDNINTNLAVGLFIFIAYQFMGFKEHGIGYLKQFTGGLPPKGYPVGITAVLSGIAILMVFIELIGHAIRPVSLSLRLWGNINGDHTLVGVFLGIVPLFLPMVFMLLGLFVSCVQAVVFALLSTVYFKLAVSHDH